MTTLTSTIKWLVGLTSVYLKHAPIATPIAVVMTLFTQLAMMMAFLMPLKVVMLLSSEGIPRFFPGAFLAIDRNTLVILLVVLSITSYIASVIFKYIADKATESGVKKLLDKTQKIVIFENQDSIASNAYTKHTNALAGLIFAVISISMFFVFYQDIATLTAGFLLLAYITVYLIFVSNTHLEPLINEKYQTISSSISNIGFFLIFLYIVIDFLYLTPPDFIVAMATIIISRLMLVRLGFTMSYLFSLKQDERKINALFFHHHAFVPANTNQHQTVWNLLTPNTNLNWVKPILEAATNLKIDESDIVTEWKQTRLKDILVLTVEVPNQRQTFLIKVFEDKLKSQALNESTLMVELDSQVFPCPPFLLATTVAKYHCHIFDITGYEFLSPKEAFKRNNEVNDRLLMITPPEKLEERYKRSKALLWERLNINIADRLYRVASEEKKQSVRQFEDAIPDIQTILRDLPLSFINFKQNHTSLLRDLENQIVSFHWPTWTIEPTGFGIDFQVNENEEEINKVILVASENRTELKQFPIESYRLVGLMSDFERCLDQQQYEDAIEFCQLILDKLTTLKLAINTIKKPY